MSTTRQNAVFWINVIFWAVERPLLETYVTSKEKAWGDIEFEVPGVTKRHMTVLWLEELLI